MTETSDSPETEETSSTRGHEVAEYALLGLLRDGPRHGYRLAAEFSPNGRLGIVLRLKMGQMYAYLRKLERHRLLVAHDEPGQMAGRTRRVFTWTSAGQRVFEAWLAAPVEATRDLRLAFLVKLAFTLEDSHTALALLDRQRAATAAWLARLRGYDRDSDSVAATQATLRWLSQRRRVLQTEAALTWLDETRALVESRVSRASGAAGEAGGGASDR
jgi:PadR family transcriptional regulator AphA